MLGVNRSQMFGNLPELRVEIMIYQQCSCGRKDKENVFFSS